MNKYDIYSQYNTWVFNAPWWAKYINYSIVVDVVEKLFSTWNSVFGYEMLYKTDKFIQPYMKYSIWKDIWYTKDEILKYFNEIPNIVKDENIDINGIYFDLLTWYTKYNSKI
jgi:hypothetical protein